MQGNLAPRETLQTLIIRAPISTVTLLEDRALVQRQETLTLTPGLWRITIANVAPILADKTLRGTLQNASSGDRINELQVRRQMLVKESDLPEQMRSLMGQWREFQQTFQGLDRHRDGRQSEFSELADILERAMAEVPIDAAWGRLDVQDWRSQFQELFARLRALRGEIIETYQAQEKLVRQLNDLITRIQSVSRPDYFYRANIEVDLNITIARECELIINYIVPNALWRPWHQARLQQGENPTVSLRCDGCVWQQTGEDWHNIDLIFSTARPSLGADPPLLNEDRLNIQEKSSEIVVETREQTIQTTGLGTGMQELPGVDDGGEVRILRSQTKATILSDGHPYRVPIFAWETSPEVKYILMPELATQVILKSEQVNPSEYPLLAAPVDLIRSTEFIGNTSLLFVASGEKFALGWGADAGMRVQRTQKQEQKQDAISRWKTTTITTQIYLSNISNESRTIEVTERVPISELEQVKVSIISEESTDNISADRNGFCIWNITLLPYSQKEIILVYKVQSAPDVKGLM
ncbi:MAG: mucoidy inhibitor MuiA family protein [Cyanobacteria bacterium SBLK]|nr:mucoidy inhibitor MuiA family protein [Cyanobacteria bacterium SBLK]